MTGREDIMRELRELSPVLAAVPRVNIFAVHESYFEGIQAELNARISADKFYSDNAFSVPEGYFAGLENSILEKIKAQDNHAVAAEMNDLSPLIAGIGNKNIFSVPQGYFEALEFVQEEKLPAKVIQMNPSRSRAIFRYAAAAVITGLLGISVIKVMDQKPAVAASQTATAVAVMNDANQIIKTGSFDKELASLSDAEIDQYFRAEGQDVNAALVAASANDASKLPEATDYILDENTLDNYLKENNL